MNEKEIAEMMSNAIQSYLHELASRVVAQSGIASDRYHVGKLILRSFKDAPDLIMQIDGATDEKETFKSALERSVRSATAFRNMELKYQDVVVIMAPNHLDMCVPMYAAFYLGLNVAGIDMDLGVYELKNTLKCVAPKIIFCENFNVKNVEEALKLLDMTAHIVTFGEKKDNMSFSEFLDKHSDDTTVEAFKPADFDPKETNLILGATSGSTGVPKSVMLTHENILISFPGVFYCYNKIPGSINSCLLVSPLQWITAVFQFVMAPIVKYTRVQTSAPTTSDHVNFLVKKYKPEFIIVSSTLITSLLMYCEKNNGDFSSFKHILIGGSAVSEKLIEQVRRETPQANIQIGYGMTETSGLSALPTFSTRNTRSIGKPLCHLEYKIVDVETNEDISQPHKSGELRVKGPTVSKGYYNNPEMTRLAFDEDGWLKTGDIVYRDEYCNFYFEGRLKLLLKYRNHQVSPTELESVIMKHPGVADVAVTGIPDEECGDLPVAVVIAKDDSKVTALDIKDLVKNSLTDTKQLRGGVIFVKEFPTTATSKIDRLKLKQLAMTVGRE